MISTLTKSEGSACIEFTQFCNQGSFTARYFPTNTKDIEKRIIKRLDQTDVDVLQYKEEDSIKGYMELLIDQDERYLQILVVFASPDYRQVLDTFFHYISTTFKGYKLHYVVSDRNVEVIQYMHQTNATTSGEELMIHVFKSVFKPSDIISSTLLSSPYETDFITLHNNVMPDVYWTGERLLENQNLFQIIITISDSTIDGYAVLSRNARSEEEIYFVYADSDELKIKLIHDVLSLGFQQAESIQLLLDQKERSIMPLLHTLGFQEKERIITYYIESV